MPLPRDGDITTGTAKSPWRWWRGGATGAEAWESGGAAFDPEALDSATVVKENALRRVHRVVTAEGVFFVKVHRQRGLVSRLRFLLWGGPAKNEYRASRYAMSRGVPAVRIVARAERVDSWQPHLSASVSKAIDGAERLADAFNAVAKIAEDRARRSAMRALSNAAARLLAVAHDRAFLHPDSHAGNILVQTTERGGYACYYVDLYGARCGSEVRDAEAARNLAALNQGFASRVGRTERLRFLQTYAELRNRWRSRAAFRRFVQQVSRAARRHAQRLYRKRDRRIGRRNAYFGRLCLTGGDRVDVTLRLRASRSSGESKRWSRTLDEWRTSFEEGDRFDKGEQPKTCANEVTETFFPGSRAMGVLWRVAGSPAWRRYRTAGLAMNRDLPTVAGLAHWARGSRWSVQESGWWMRLPTNGVPLLRHLENAKGRQRATILDAVGRLVADTANRGLALREVSATRIDVVADARAGGGVYWAGVEGIALRKPAPVHLLEWMLGQLLRSVTSLAFLSQTDRLRVLRACLRRAEGSAADWKACWRRIAASVR